MPPKRRGNSETIAPLKKSRNTICLKQKLDIIQRSENGESGADIGRALGLPGTTVRTILKNAEKIKGFVNDQTPLDAVRHVNKKPVPRNLMFEMENILTSWYSTQISSCKPVDFTKFERKTLSVYAELTKDIANAEPFTASLGWYERYRKRYKMNSMDTSSETGSADTDEPNSVPHHLGEVVREDYHEIRLSDAFVSKISTIVEDGEYCPQQIFNVDETILFWKSLPKHNFKDLADHLTLLLGGNAAGDFKLKPLLVYSTENPESLSGYPTNKLPVIWKTNKKLQITQMLFSDWFTSYFCPAVEKYCSKNNLPNKALLIIDIAPGHPTTLEDLSNNVKVVCVDKNSSSLQPMQQDVLRNFKAYYLHSIFHQALIATEFDSFNTFEEFWNTYDIKMAINNISEAWKKVKSHTLNKAWRKIYPHCVLETGENDVKIETIYEDIIEIGKALKIETLSLDDIKMWNNYDKKLITEQLDQLDEQKSNELESENEKITPIKALTTEMLHDALKHLQTAANIFNENDPNCERSLHVCKDIENATECYRQLYREKKKASQQHRDTILTSERISFNSPEFDTLNSPIVQSHDLPIGIKTETLSLNSPSEPY